MLFQVIFYTFLIISVAYVSKIAYNFMLRTLNSQDTEYISGFNAIFFPEKRKNLIEPKASIPKPVLRKTEQDAAASEHSTPKKVKVRNAEPNAKVSSAVTVKVQKKSSKHTQDNRP